MGRNILKASAALFLPLSFYICGRSNSIVLQHLYHTYKTPVRCKQNGAAYSSNAVIRPAVTNKDKKATWMVNRFFPVVDILCLCQRTWFVCNEFNTTEGLIKLFTDYIQQFIGRKQLWFEHFRSGTTVLAFRINLLSIGVVTVNDCTVIIICCKRKIYDTSVFGFENSTKDVVVFRDIFKM